MKKNLFSLIVIGFTSIATNAQTKALMIDTVKTPTVQCTMCKERIESHLTRIDGVRFVKVNVKRKETIVKYLTDRTNIEVIKASIANAGYDANEIEANPDYYKMLPKCCKKPEDGGGMQKN